MSAFTDVLAAHQVTDERRWANERYCSCGEAVHTMIPARSHAAHVEVELAKAGIAITQLPEPDETHEATEDEHGRRLWSTEGGCVTAFDSGWYEIDSQYSHDDDPQKLRGLAAALLAAAASIPTKEASNA